MSNYSGKKIYYDLWVIFPQANAKRKTHSHVRHLESKYLLSMISCNHFKAQHNHVYL